MSERDYRPLTGEEARRLKQVDDIDLRTAKSHVFSIRLSASEMREFAEAARAADMKLGTFIKDAARETLQRRKSLLPRMRISKGADGMKVVLRDERDDVRPPARGSDSSVTWTHDRDAGAAAS